ncbi:MAG TPA: HPF/RaiA family ribosome-associated protein [Terriglobales bacterium]|jgi:ribosomal subunit interface protein
MHIRTRVTESDISKAFSAYIERRLRFALGRFADRVGRVNVRLKADGPGGHQCHMTAQIVPFGRVMASENDFDLFTAVDRAAGKLGQQFGRALERMRDAKVGPQSVRLAA